jgi:signal peptidase I
MPYREEKQRRGCKLKRSHLAREVVETVVLTILIFLVIRFVIQSYHVEGPSMQPGLSGDEYVVVNKVTYLFHAPERGDVIVFHYPYTAPNQPVPDYIKRVIGLPGDTIRTDFTHVWVNGVELKEPYIKKPVNPQGQQWTVPPNDYFVLGDNREVSDDSRYWGFVPKDFIVGKAVVIYWPINQWKLLNTYPAVYSTIKVTP